MKTPAKTKPPLYVVQAGLAASIREHLNCLVALLAQHGQRVRVASLVNIRKALAALPPDPELRTTFATCSRLCWRLAETVHPWATSWVRHRRARLTSCGVEVGDVISEMMIGFFNAAWRWDPARGARYLTYAAPHAKVRVQRMLFDARSPVHVPTHASATAARADALASSGLDAAEVREALGREARTAELARPTMTWLDAPVPRKSPEEASGALNHDSVAWTGHGPEALVAEAEADAVQRKAIAAVLHGDTRTAEVLDRRLGLSTTNEPEALREIGDDLGLSRERIRQIEHAGLHRLRASPEVARAFGRRVGA